MAVLPNTRYVQILTNQNPFSFVSSDSDLGQVHRIHLKSIVIPNTEYNVNSKTASINITAADMIAVGPIPLGQYNITQYLAALKVVLDTAAAPNTFTITQSALTKKITFTKSGGAEFTIGAESDSRRLIGQSSAKTSTGLVLVCDNIPDLSGLRVVVFKSYTLGKFKISEGDTEDEKKKSNVMGGMPMTVGFGEMLKVEESEETLNAVYFPGYKNISNFDMELVDESGNRLELNGVEWMINMEVHVKGAK